MTAEYCDHLTTASHLEISVYVPLGDEH
jgi:hypothetical protein